MNPTTQTDTDRVDLTLEWPGEPVVRTTLAAFLTDNADDPDGCEEVRDLLLGEYVVLGGGAQPQCLVRRVQPECELTIRTTGPVEVTRPLIEADFPWTVRTAPVPTPARRERGSSLVKGKDEGGDRWYLDGTPIHTGSGLELALERNGTECEGCHGNGTKDATEPTWIACKWCHDGLDGSGRPCRDCDGKGKILRAVGEEIPCPECEGRGSVFEIDWLRVRFETEHVAAKGGGVQQVPVIYFPAAECGSLHARVPDSCKFRLPPRRAW